MHNQQPTVIITGGTKGIGAAIASIFHQRGFMVVIGARTRTPFIKTLGEHGLFISMDVRRATDHVKLTKAALKLTGRVDVYINCAGFSAWRPVAKIDQQFLAMMIDTNLKGAFYGCQAAAVVLSDDGVIINVSSLAGKRGSANNSAYCMAKFGVTGLTQSLAKELGPRGIRVNAVCPVYVATENVMTALAKPASPANGNSVTAYLKQFAKEQAALRRLPLDIEVAKACWFLASPEASAITGQSLNVDCGVFPQ